MVEGSMRIALIFGAAALAFAAGHPNLNGTWQSADAAETVAIHQTDDEVQITETVKDKQSELKCNTSGQTCKLKDGEVSFWYNGAALVMMETSHGNSRVVKKRWTSSDDG